MPAGTATKEAAFRSALSLSSVSPGSAVPPFVSSSTPLPELRFLRLPFRF